MIIWSGLGFLVAVVVFGFSLAANFITNSVTGGEAYWDTHRWPLAVSLFFSAATCFVLGRVLHNKEAQVLIDPQTGKEVVFRRSHALFFIPMLYWSPILAVIAVVVLMAEFVK